MQSKSFLHRAVFALAAVALTTLAPAYDLIYGPGGARVTWNNGTIPMVIRMPQTPNFQDGTNYATSVQAALNAWNEQLANVQFSSEIVAAGAAADNGINEIVLADQIYGDDTTPPEDFGPNVLAVTLSFRTGSPRGDGTYERVESDILFNTGITGGWNSYRGNLQYPEDIQRVAIHELGHVLGLDHPDEDGQTVTAIMNSTVSNTDALQTDDITGAQFQYGRPGGFTAPANNNFANATTITLSNNAATVSGSSIGANKESGEPYHAPDEPGGASVWWKWTATSNGTLTVTTAGSHFDTMLAAYTGSAVNSLTQLAANDDVQNGVVRTSSVTISVSNGTTYYFAVDGWEGEWGSSTLNLSFTPTNNPPQFSAHPQNLTTTDGNSNSFSVGLIGGLSGTTLRWQRLPAGSATWQELTDGATYSGTASIYLAIAQVTLGMSGDQFRCVATNGSGSTISNAATLTVQARAPVIVTQPVSVDILPGGSVTFTVGAIGSAPLSYQWYRNWAPIAGATGTTLSLENLGEAQNYDYYHVVVSNSAGSATSTTVRTTVVTQPPGITQQPTPVVLVVGSTLSFYVEARGAGTLRYQWYRDGQAIAGATTAYLRVNSVAQSHAGNYHVTVSNVAGTVTSATVRVEVLLRPPPENIRIRSYGGATLGAAMELTLDTYPDFGASPSYQWYRDGVPIAGATLSSYSVSAAGPADFGSYFLTVTNSAGTGVSNTVTPSYTPLARNVRPALWSRSREYGGIVYFLFADTPRIARYDLAGENWLTTWALPATATDFEVTSEGVYVAYAGKLTRYSLEFANPVDTALATAETRELVTRPGQLLVVSRISYYDWSFNVIDRATGQVLTAHRLGASVKPTGGFVYSSPLRRLFGISLSTSPHDIWQAEWRDDGVIGSFTDSPYHGENEPGQRTFALRNGLLIAEHRGVVYSGIDLTRVGNLGGAFDDLIEMEDGRLVLARAGSLVLLDAAFNQIGRTAFASHVAEIARRGDEVVGFAPPAAAGGLPEVAKRAIATVGDTPATAAREPQSRVVWSPELRADGFGNIYVYSRLDGNIFRWSAYEARYTDVVPLRGYADKWAIVAEQGAIYHDEAGLRLRRADGGGATRSFFNSHWPVTGLHHAGRFLLNAGFGYTLLGPRGTPLHHLGSGERSVAFEWSEANRRLYHFRSNSSPDDLLRNTISETGVIGGSVDSPYHGEVRAITPIRVSNDGQRIALGSGQIFSASDLTLLGSLPQTVTDAAWTGAQTLHTLRSVYSGAELTTWSNDRTALRSTIIPGIAVALFAIPGDYLVVVTSTAGVLSYRTVSPVDHQTVDLAAVAAAPVILRQPTATTANVGDRMAFSVAAHAGTNATYRWLRDGQSLANGPGIAGADTATLVLESVGLDNAGAYRVIVTNASGSTASTEAVLTVAVVAPRIIQQPAGAAVGLGRSHTLVVAADDALPLTYQWHRDNTPIDGATGPMLIVSNFGAENIGSYTVVVSNGTQNTTSSAAQLTLVPLPVLTVQPQNLIADVGSNAEIFVPAPAGTNYSYQWYKDGQPLLSENYHALSFRPLSTADAGNYYVRVSNASGAVVSVAVTVTPVTRAPRITLQPVSRGTLVGQSTSFYIDASAAPAPSFQWQSMPPGGSTWANYATGRDLNIWNPTLAHDGTRFRCIVTNEFGSVTSDEVFLRVGTSAAAASISAGGAHSIVLATNGNTLVSGANNFGQIGVGSQAGWSSFTANLYNMRHAVAGESTSYFIGSYGQVYATGNNTRGQFGNNSVSPGATQPTDSFWAAINLAPGHRHALAIMSDGSLWGAGANDQGQLGDGTRTDRISRIRIAGRAAAIAAGHAHSFYVHPDGSLWAMGANTDGQFGDGSATGSIVPVQVGTQTVAVSTYHHAMFLRRDGTLWTAGRNDRGQLGNNSTAAARTAVQVANGVVAISAGALHSVFLKSDGTAWAMGANDRGQLGDGTVSDRRVPVQVASGVWMIAAGHYHTLILKTDGSVWATGANESGQLGDGTNTDRASWVRVVNAGVALYPTLQGTPAADAGTGRHYTQLTWQWPRGGSFFEVWRGTTNDFTQATLLATRLTVSRYADYSAAANTTYHYWVRVVNTDSVTLLGPPVSTIHDGTAPTVPVITAQPTSVTVGEGGRATFSVSATGTGTLSYYWRRNGIFLAGANAATLIVEEVDADKTGTYSVLVVDDEGQTMSADAELTLVPAFTSIDSAAQSLDGLPRLYTIAVTSNAAWSASSDSSWLSVGPSRGFGNNEATVIADANLTGAMRTGTITIGGVVHTVTQTPAPNEARKVWVAGLDNYGQLGQGRLLRRDEFDVAFTNAKSVVAGPRSSYFIHDDDSLWFTGVDFRGGAQGDPAARQTDFPSRIAGSIARVAASQYHLLYLTTDGTLWACGNNGMGELGLGVGEYSREPRVVTTGVREIAAGTGISLFVKNDGTVWGTGSRYSGAMGGALPDGFQYLPVQVASGAVAVSTGTLHSAIIKSDGTLWMTGSNTYGQLGTGDTNTRRDWVQVASGVAAVHCTERTTLFRKTDGTLWGMGDNNLGQLGGTSLTQIQPRQIAVGATAIAGSSAQTCWVTSEGELWTLGGIGPVYYSQPQKLAIGIVQASSMGGNMVVLKAGGTVLTIGSNSVGQLGARSLLARSVPVQVGTDGRQVGVGEDYFLWNDSTGTVRGAGFGRFYQLNASLETANTARTVATGILSSGVGNHHSLHIRSDGALVGFGNNSYGQLGLAGNWNYLVTTLQPAAIAAYAGYGFSFFIKADRTLWAMGRNDSGQLGAGNTTYHLPATQVLDGVAAVALGTYHTMALRTDGTLWATGNNGSGQLGTGDAVNRTNFTQITSGVRSVAAGESFTAWVKLDGTAWIVGAAPVSVNGSTLGSVPRQISADVVSVAAHGGSLFVLKHGGELWCAGRNDFGQLADGTFDFLSALKKIGLGVLSMSVGERNSAFIAPAGFITTPQPPVITVQPQPQSAVLGGSAAFSVTATGAAPLSYQWQLNGSDIPGATASTLTLSNLAANQVGYYSVVVSNAAGTAQSSIAALDLAVPPSIIAQPQARTVYTGLPATLSVAATGGGLSYQWRLNGVPLQGATSSIMTIASVRTEDAGDYSVIVTNAAGTTTSTSVSLTVLPGSAPVITLQPQSQTTGLDGRVVFTVAATGTPSPTYRWQRLGIGWTEWEDLTESNSYRSYGWNTPTLVALSTAVDVNSGHRYRVIVSNPLGSVTSDAAVLNIHGYVAPTSVAAGYTMTMGVRADGQTASTGANYAGQQGTGTLTPSTNLLTPFGGLQEVVAAYLGFDYSHLIKLRGELWVTGDNQLGQLGDGSTTGRSTPVRIAGSFAGAAGGYRHSLFRTNSGVLLATGYNSSGQLGDGTTTNRSSPVQVATNVVAAAAGFSHSLFVKGDGTAYGMGSNNGLFGNGSTAGSLTPLQIATGIADVATFYHTAFLKRDGTVWTTGRNDRGQLGLGDTSARTTATQVASGVVEIAVGALHTVLLKSDGTVWTFGANDRGQLGDGTTLDRTTPVQVAANVATISAGLLTTAILKNDGTLWMAGANEMNQLGDNSTTDRATFIQVASGQPAVPSDPVVPTATVSDTADRVSLTWTSSRGATFYRIWRHTADDPSQATVLVARVKGTYFEDTTAASGVTYRYWVQPVNQFGAWPLLSSTAGRRGAALVAPVISSAPSSQTVAINASATFSVTATGSAPLTYQWRKGTTPLDGATSSTYTISSVTIADAGDYSVVVTNAAGSVTSTSATLTVNKLSQTITFGVPADRPIDSGNFALTAAASSGLPVAFAVLSGPAVPFTTGSNIFVPLGTGTVVVRATQAGDDTYAAAPAVERSFQILPPRYDSFSDPLRVASGYVVSYGNTTWATREQGEPNHAANPTGSASLWWVWTAPYSANVQITTTGSNFDTLLAVYTGSALDSLVEFAANDDAGEGNTRSSVSFWTPGGVTYYIAIDGKNGAKGAAQLNIGAIPSSGTAPVFTQQPQSATAEDGSVVQFSIQYTGAFPTTLAWQWLSAGSETWAYVSSADTVDNSFTGMQLSIRASTAMDGAQFRCVASNSLGTTYSSAATLSVFVTLDSWSLEHFTEAELLDPAISGPNADPDGDGFRNLVEYALGLDPKAASSTGLPEAARTETDWSFTYTRPAARSDVTYTVQSSTNLTTWTTVTATRIVEGSTETWRATVPVSGNPNLFFRLKVTR